MTRGIIVKIVNNTAQDLSVSATVGHAPDWGDNLARPDLNMTGTIPASGCRHWHEELAQTSATAPFTVSLQPPSGPALALHLDGWQTRQKEWRRQLPTADASLMAFQYTGEPEKDLQHGDWKQMTVCISEAVDPLQWMSRLDPSLRLDQINIPGTHDTGTWGGTGPDCTQAISITDQLVAGIRWFDFRLWADGQDLVFVHGARMPLTLSTALREIREFLAHNTEETVITCVNMQRPLLDGQASPTDTECQEFDALLHKVYMAGVVPNRLYDRTAIPTLDEVRGCVALLRRDRLASFGMRANDGWPDNDTKEFSVRGAAFFVEDEYKFFATGTLQGTIDEKYPHVEKALDKARTVLTPGYWPIIFTSATLKTLPLAGYYPRDFATGPNGMNGLLFGYLVGKAKARFGTIVMDYPEEPGDNAVINLILAMNTYSS